MREKSSGKCILIDFKTAKIKANKKDKEKQLEDYLNQFNLYSYFLWIGKGLEISEIRIWFLRDEIEKVIKLDMFSVQRSLDWFEETIKNIKIEDKWEPNLDKSNAYFCEQICSMRQICEHRNA